MEDGSREVDDVGDDVQEGDAQEVCNMVVDNQTMGANASASRMTNDTMENNKVPTRKMDGNKIQNHKSYGGDNSGVHTTHDTDIRYHK